MDIERDGQRIELIQESPVVENLLQTGRILFNPGAGEGGRQQWVPWQLFQTVSKEGGNKLRCFRGLLPVVQRALGKGRPSNSSRKVPAGPTSPSASEQGSLLPPVLDAFFRENQGGLVKYSGGSEVPARIIDQVGRALPDQSIAVVVPTINEGQQLRQALAKYLTGVCLVSGRNRPADSSIGQVVVATPVGLGHTGIEIEKRNILIAVNVPGLLGNQARSCMIFAKKARIFGFLPFAAQLAPLERDLVRGHFGFEEIRLNAEGKPERPVEALMCLWPGCQNLANSMDLLSVLRNGIWKNRVRNRSIATLAKLILAGDNQEAEKQFPDLFSAGTFTGKDRVLVLVENIEHAAELSQFLSWPIKRSKSAFLDGLKPYQLTRLAKPALESGSKVICTTEGLTDWKDGGIDVVIRADGGIDVPSSLDVSIQLNRNSSSRDVLLIDFQDRHHPLLRQRSRERDRAYQERGWFGPGVDKVQARVSQFIADRPVVYL